MRRSPFLPRSARPSRFPRSEACMAAMEEDVTTLKGQCISVSVEEALIDVLVVAFQFGAKSFHGVLLDITKKNRPFGINNPWFCSSSGVSGATPPTLDDKVEDRLFSVKQRHTYFQHGSAGPDVVPFAKLRRAPNGGKGTKDQGVRMRRLRPRQVLCSQCRSICNENSENVQKKVTTATSDSNTLTVAQTRSLNAQHKPVTNTNTPASSVSTQLTVPRGVLTRSCQQQQEQQPTLCQPPPATPSPPLLIPSVTTTTTTATTTSITSDSSSTTTTTIANTSTVTKSVGHSHPITDEYRASSIVQGKMILRKRRLDEEPEDQSHVSNIQSPVVTSECQTSITPPVPVLRISFANPEGTVVKIASSCDAGTKAARKALKKAKKEAQRRQGQQNQAPEDSPTSILPHRHRKHHKRKRRRRDENEVDEDDLVREEGWGCSKDPFIESDMKPVEGLYEEVRNNCLRQKLSISLKRLSAQAYARLSPKHSTHHHHHHHGHHHHLNHEELTSMEDEEDVGSDDGRVPDFPRHEPLQPHPQAQATAQPIQSPQSPTYRPLMMRITSQSVNRCVLEGGREMSVGDVVWGKIHGFPWWPGKVLSLTVSRREGGCGTVSGVPVAYQAHVAWFGSSTSSYMPCHQLAPFLRHFKARYNRKKRGPYKEAIRQAQLEAERLQPPVPPTFPPEETVRQEVT